MRQQFKLSPLLIAVVLVIGLIGYLYLPNGEGQQQRQGRASPVVVTEVKQQALPIIVEALGTARANEAVVITAQETDKIEQILFDDGDLVQAGQLLLTLNSREEQSRVEELQINLAEARRQLQRVQGLAAENAASQQLLDERQAEVDALIAQLAVANAILSDLKIHAPFSGLLGVREVSEGALVRPGDVITTLDDLATVKVDFSIAERHLPSIALGQSLAATSVAYPGETFDGEVSHIASRVDPVTRAVQIRAKIANPELKLRPGMLLQIVVQKQVLDTLVVPETALVPIEDRQYVYVVDADNKAKQVQVQLGERRPGLAQVISGLQEGDKVVVEGTLRLRDGATVRLVGDGQ